MSAYVFVAVAGGSLGLLAGGALTQALSWHWIFFVNLPIGVATFAARQGADPRRTPAAGSRGGVDWLGSVLVTASLMTAVYAIVQATSHGWGSTQVLGFGALAIVADGRLPGRRSADREPDHAAADPAPARPGRLERGARIPRHRDVLDVLPRHALPRARAPLQRAADRPRLPALDADRRASSRSA